MPIWVDSEVHLFPPQWCRRDYYPPAAEAVMRRVIYDHPEREQALAHATAEGLIKEMEAAGLDRAVIMGLPWQEPQACRTNNAYIAEAVGRYPDRFIGFGVLAPPNSGDPGGAVRQMHEEFGLRGLKVIPSWHGRRLTDPIFEPLFRQLIENNMVLMPHTDHLYVSAERADTAAALLEVRRRYPELKILAPHLGGLLCLYALHGPVRSALKNIMFITSVPATMPMVTFAVEAIGAEHLSFGTDFPFNTSHDQRQVRRAFEALPLTAEQKNMIAGANVLRFLGADA